jgi:membrane protein
VAASLFSFRGLSAHEILKRTWADIRADDVTGRAAQLAYYFFLALFPFLICVIASLSVFGAADRGRALLFGLFARFLPLPVFELISDTFEQILRSNGPLKMSVGILATLWSASMGMGAIMDTLNGAYNVRETRSLLKQYVTAIGLTGGIALLLVTCVLVFVYGTAAAGTIEPGFVTAHVWTLLQSVLGLTLVLLAFAITYYFGPDVKERHWHWVTPGSIAGLLLLIAMSVCLRVYFRYARTSSATFGSLGAVIALLLCFYLAGIAVLAGGVLNGILERNARRFEADNRKG